MARTQRPARQRLDGAPGAAGTLPLLMPYTCHHVTAPAAASHGMCMMLPAFTRAMGARMMITITPAAT
ncbi:hypothetical protein C6571_08350 [Simplicispira suum]|uniref:Uncharacterized protein n=1 Tax=Simplicispira suum TaxID=2109915 RepID=A0A2S0MZI1_9BURK|nr:hypothetical protein C6571_08350 [Simplicispira suum]